MPSSLTVPHTVVDARDPADKTVLLQGAVEGHVLVKNNGALPLNSPRVIYVAGYSAREPDQTSPTMENTFAMGLESMSDTSSTSSTGLAAALNGTIITGGGSGSTSKSAISSPFHALVSRALEDDTLLYWDFESATPTADTAADVCLVVVNSWAEEGQDRPGVRDTYTDTLISSVAGSCANTVVVVHNAGARIVDSWIDHDNVTAVVFAHLPGQASGQALVSLLFGDDNFSGKLPYTVPKNESDYGSLLSPSLPEGEYTDFPQSDFTEGVYVDYRRFDYEDIEPRFEFGFGLSYTTFNYSCLHISSQKLQQSAYPVGAVLQGGQSDLWDGLANVSVAVTNSGDVAGQEVAQLYVSIPGAPERQLRGFEKVAIEPQATVTVDYSLTRRDLSVWDASAQKWKLQNGTYTVYVGSSSRKLPLQETLVVSYGNWSLKY